MTIDDDDKDLFRRAVAGARPLSQQPMKITAQPRPQKRPTEKKPLPAKESNVSGEDLAIGDPLSFLRKGVDPRLLKKLRRGDILPQAELDLHGHTVSEARLILQQFLAHCREDRIQCALIIHGKGWRSERFKPVLKNQLNRWLPGFPEVIAFCSAKPKHGGSGAAYVLLGQNIYNNRLPKNSR